MRRKVSLISGLVRDSDGKPVPNARVSFVESPVPVPDIAALVDNYGAFTISAPVPGDYTIEVMAGGFVRKKLKISVLDNEEKHVEVTLPRLNDPNPSK